MAVILIENPTNVPDEVSTGYERQNLMLYAIRTGFMRIGVVNMDGTAAPQIQEGSIFEVNGALYKCAGNEGVSGTPVAGENYVYAVPNAGGAAFQYSAVKPVWSAVKGGWYNGNNRAVLEFTYAGGGYISKLVTDIYNYKSRFAVNMDIPIPDTGGALIFQAGKVNQAENVWLYPGAYRIELKGGRGGNGGNGGMSGVGPIYGGNGGIGTDGQSIIYKVYVTEQKNIVVFLGGDGGRGSDSGGSGASGGGGGAPAAGTTVRFVMDDVSITAMGGSGGGGGGGGGAGRSSGLLGGGGGGGGGKGFGIGTDGGNGGNGSYSKGGSGGSGGGDGVGGSGGDGGYGYGGVGRGGNGYRGSNGRDGDVINGSGKCPVRTLAGSGGTGGTGYEYMSDSGPVYYGGMGGGGGGGSSGVSESLAVSGGRAPAGTGAAVEIYRVTV